MRVPLPEKVRTEDRIDLDGVVHPSARRRGIGTALLRWQEERAAGLHAARYPDLPGGTKLGTVDHVASKVALAAAHGYRDIRWWNEMTRDLEPLFTGSTHLRPDESFLVLDGEDVAAYLLTHFYPADEAATGRRSAYIGQVGTLRPWRRRGLGTLLLATALTAFARAGYDEADLGVDTANPTGALGLYERVGFVPRRRAVTSVKPLG